FRLRRGHFYAYRIRGMPPVMEAKLTRRLQKKLRKRFGAEGARAFGVVTDPLRKGIVLEEHRALLKLALLHRQGRLRGARLSKALAAHAGRYGWMKNVGYLGQLYPVSYYKRRLDALLRADPAGLMRLAAADDRRKKRAFGRLLKACADDRMLVRDILIANEAVAFRSYRMEML